MLGSCPWYLSCVACVHSMCNRAWPGQGWCLSAPDSLKSRMGFENTGLWKGAFSSAKLKCPNKELPCIGLWKYLSFHVNELPVLFDSVQYWAWDLVDQGSWDTPEELFPLSKPVCAIFKYAAGFLLNVSSCAWVCFWKRLSTQYTKTSVGSGRVQTPGRPCPMWDWWYGAEGQPFEMEQGCWLGMETWPSWRSYAGKICTYLQRQCGLSLPRTDAAPLLQSDVLSQPGCLVPSPPPPLLCAEQYLPGDCSLQRMPIAFRDPGNLMTGLGLQGACSAHC